ncbi:MAG: two pore domain potassium channel family protein [Deltaproteobacteria bacterium]|uniref:Two pore domain potassium channel family protein n=1 Tax=Candidatus Zymogenus saltonus TaxID=2844893 RepID=A0A9D8KG75_9DELT|nr:two pore domain potassium channel family protein [Candidatus Zymogenus saltonus]
MLAFITMVIRFVRTIFRGLKDPEFRGLLYLVIFTLMSGTGFYHKAEGWKFIDSLYFSVVTLTTIGYGDLAPTKPISKIFTIIYIFIGIGILIMFIDKVARTTIAAKEEKRAIREAKKKEKKAKKEGKVD